ncbi:uncharacterized protein LOC106060688 isoform X3 [Biomphalaria glabrata]|uniref:Uncharacterized protein LOC106060688 isoform X2 n=1 Tax=Biomphalaria glabrata TaxID=6526 RepID=A0A9W3BHU8_BIOGL|nr:uncharacterized protein LOC106060688 isoform X2 [Biomphalaria glabrata]XP_055899007.1 uncharacterized protein LOC106060688 isoform X3 [Biomphalaria glabrata]
MGHSVYFFCVWTLTLWGFFSISKACLQEGSQCARVMQTGEMRMDQLDQLCPKLSSALSCLNAAIATCTSDAERSNLNSGKMGLEQQYNTLCSGGCSIADIMKCSPKNMDQPPALNEETCQGAREMKVCIADVRAKCTQEDIKAQIDMQIQFADYLLTQCASITPGSGGCSIADIMRCSPNNTDQLSIVNEETCKAVRQMKVCIAEVRAKCTQEDIKAQIDMQIQGLEQMLPQCPNTTSEPKKKKKVKIPKIKKIKKTKKIKNLKKDEKEDRKKKEETTKTKVFVVTESPTSQVSSLSEGTINLTVMFCIICT